VPINTYSLLKSVQIIEDYCTCLNSYALMPLSLVVCHTIILQILRALTKKHGPVGLIHVDSHSDTNDAFSYTLLRSHATKAKLV
ncbi:arginase family protein, partial [Escherichia coli]|uniref:arginase family protein n=1 Tax=Escherichia coli TaxID=562 RepID=UPI00193A5C73